MTIRLFVSRSSTASARTRTRVEELQSALPWAPVEVIDISDDPAAADAAGILRTPTLLVETEGRRMKLVGEFRSVDVVLEALGLGTGPSPA